MYVEAPSPEDVQRALGRTYGVYLNQGIHLVPLEDRVQLLELRVFRSDVTQGGWARVKTGLYKGDVGHVLEVDTLRQTARVLLIPRISYQKQPNGRKRAHFTRPLSGLFDPARARAIFEEDAIDKRDGFILFQKEKYKDGLLNTVLNLRNLTTTDARPSFTEIEAFSQSPSISKAVRASWDIEDAVSALQLQDQVRVIQGELQGSVGTICDKQDNTVQVHFGRGDNIVFDDDQLLHLPAHQVRKHFELGDFIRVRHGVHSGKRGYVVQVSDSNLEFVESNREVWFFLLSVSAFTRF